MPDTRWPRPPSSRIPKRNPRIRPPRIVMLSAPRLTMPMPANSEATESPLSSVTPVRSIAGAGPDHHEHAPLAAVGDPVAPGADLHVAASPECRVYRGECRERPPSTEPGGRKSRPTKQEAQQATRSVMASPGIPAA